MSYLGATKNPKSASLLGFPSDNSVARFERRDGTDVTLARIERDVNIGELPWRYLAFRTAWRYPGGEEHAV